MKTILERLDALEDFKEKMIDVVGTPKQGDLLVSPDEARELTCVIVRMLVDHADGELPAGTELTALLAGDIAFTVLVGDDVASTILFPPKKKDIEWEVVSAYVKADDRKVRAEIEAHKSYIDELQEELTNGIKTASRRAELLKQCRETMTHIDSVSARRALVELIDKELE